MLSALRDHSLPKAIAALMLALAMLVSVSGGTHASAPAWSSQVGTSIEAESHNADGMCQGHAGSHHVEKDVCPDGCCTGSCPVASLVGDTTARELNSWNLRFDVVRDGFLSHFSSGQLRPPMV
jgi:hypothetical protein